MRVEKLSLTWPLDDEAVPSAKIPAKSRPCEAKAAPATTRTKIDAIAEILAGMDFIFPPHAYCCALRRECFNPLTRFASDVTHTLARRDQNSSSGGNAT